MQEITTQTKRELSVLERINQKETIYLCYDCKLNPTFGTASYAQACRYARENNQKFSIYPVGTYSEIA